MLRSAMCSQASDLPQDTCKLGRLDIQQLAPQDAGAVSALLARNCAHNTGTYLPDLRCALCGVQLCEYTHVQHWSGLYVYTVPMTHHFPCLRACSTWYQASSFAEDHTVWPHARIVMQGDLATGKEQWRGICPGRPTSYPQCASLLLLWRAGCLLLTLM